MKNMKIDIKNVGKTVHNVISNCIQCAERKSPGKQVSEKLHYSAKNPFESVALDVSGPLPKTMKNNSYLLSIIDVFSRFIVLVPLNNIETKTIIDALNANWISLFGFPKILISDGGSNFTSNEMREYCLRHSIQHHVTSAYHPSSNGLVERSFFTIKDMIYATSKKENADWDEVIWRVLLGLRASKSSLNYTPFEIVFGFNPRLSPLETDLNNKLDRRKIRKEIYDRNEEISMKNKTFLHKFKVGDTVMVRSATKKVGINEKRYFGPGKVVKCLDFRSYLVNVEGKTVHRHENHLKRTCLKEHFDSYSSTFTSVYSAKKPALIQPRYPERSRLKTARYGFDL